MSERPITRHEAAERMGVHVNTIRNWLGNGTLTALERGEVERMRSEMLSQFAPATELPTPQRDVRGTPVAGDLL